MLLTNYQITEIFTGTFIFPILYYIYLYNTSKDNIIYLDILYCTIILFIILLFKFFYINFNILQSQNLSSNNIVNGIY
jgi:multisubunit Na+/H+ antiporter MnhF subunit